MLVITTQNTKEEKATSKIVRKYFNNVELLGGAWRIGKSLFEGIIVRLDDNKYAVTMFAAALEARRN